MREQNIQREIMLAASERGFTVWRNNTGKAWQGRRLDVSGADVIMPSGSRLQVGRGVLLSDPRPVEFGLCPGSSDLIGLRSFRILPCDVGTRIAQFVAIEVKTDTGRVAKDQRVFLEHVANAGGLGILARSPDDLAEYELER